MRSLTIPLTVMMLPALSLAATTPAPVFVAKWGSHGSAPGQFSYPRRVATGPDGSVYVADFGNNRIQKFTTNGAFILQWGTPGSGDGQFDQPQAVAVDAQGYVYTIEVNNARVQKFTASGGFVTKWGSYGSCEGEFDAPIGIGLDSGGYVYVAEPPNRRIQKFTADGSYVTQWGSWGAGCWPGEWNSSWLFATDVAGNPAGNVLAAAGSILEYSTTGTLLHTWGTGQVNSLFSLAADGTGRIFVTDAGANRIEVFSSDGTLLAAAGTAGSGDGQFSDPYGIAVDGQGSIFVCDTGNHRIQKFTIFMPTPTMKTSFGQLKLRYR